MLPIMCTSIHSSPSNCLSNTPSHQRTEIYTHVGLVRYGALILYGWTDWLLCFLVVVFPPCCVRCSFYSFLIPLYPTFVQELDCARLKLAMAMDIERISLQGRKWIPSLRMSQHHPRSLVSLFRKVMCLAESNVSDISPEHRRLLAKRMPHHNPVDLIMILRRHSSVELYSK